MSSDKPKRGGGRPIGPLTKKLKHFDRPSSRKRIETDADQLRIKLAIDTKYAGPPDLGRVIPKGSDEFRRIEAELLARENKSLGVDMGTKGKVCDVPGCSSFQWKGNKCWKHHPEHVAKREARAAARVVAVSPPVIEPVVNQPAVAEPVGMQFCEECGAIPCACFDEVALPVGFGRVVNGDGEPVPFGVDPVILMALREAWHDKEAAMLAKLSGMRPGAAVCCAARMVESIELMGF